MKINIIIVILILITIPIGFGDTVTNGGITLEAGTDSKGVILFDGPTADAGDRPVFEDGQEDKINLSFGNVVRQCCTNKLQF